MQVADLLLTSSRPSESDEKELNDTDNTHFITISSDAEKQQIEQLAKAGNFAAIDDLITKGADIRWVVFCVAQQATEDESKSINKSINWIIEKIGAVWGDNYANLIDAARGGFILAKNETMVTTLVTLAPSDFSIYGYTVFALAFMDKQEPLLTQLNAHFNEANMDAALRGAMVGEHTELIKKLNEIKNFDPKSSTAATEIMSYGNIKLIESGESDTTKKMLGGNTKLIELWESDYDSEQNRIITLFEQASKFDQPIWKRWLCCCFFSTKVTGRVAELCVTARQDIQLPQSTFIEQLESIEGIQSSPWIWRCIEFIRYQNSADEMVSEFESSVNDDVSEWRLMHPVT